MISGQCNKLKSLKLIKSITKINHKTLIDDIDGRADKKIKGMLRKRKLNQRLKTERAIVMQIARMKGSRLQSASNKRYYNI